MVFMFLTLSFRATKVRHLEMTLFWGAEGFICLVYMSLIRDVRLSVSIWSQRVFFHDSNCISISATKSHISLRDTSSDLQSLSCL